jgi:hypothetical protein
LEAVAVLEVETEGALDRDRGVGAASAADDVGVGGGIDLERIDDAVDTERERDIEEEDGDRFLVDDETVAREGVGSASVEEISEAAL